MQCNVHVNLFLIVLGPVSVACEDSFHYIGQSLKYSNLIGATLVDYNSIPSRNEAQDVVFLL